MKKIWQKDDLATNILVNTFTVGKDLDFDERLAKYDVKGSMAHCQMLAETGIISGEESEQMLSVLTDILKDIENGNFEIDKEAEDMEARMEKGLFDLNDMANYLTSMNKMGGLSALMQMMPGIGRVGDLASQGIDDRLLKRQLAMIQSMTPKERRHYQLLTGSRKKRIAAGAGVDSSDVSKLIRQYEQVKSMMDNMGLLGGKGMNNGILDSLRKWLPEV